MNNCENCFDISPMIGRLVGVTRTMRLALYKGEGVPTGTPQDLTGLTVVVRVLRDGTADIFLPEFVIEGNDNNIVKFVWPATEQAVGNYTFDVTFTDGGINVNRIDWHGPRGMRLVEHSYQVYGDDSFGVKSNEEIGLIGYFTTSGVGMSAFEVWAASPESEGYEKTVEGFMEYLRQPATDAAEEAEADHERAAADHATAVADHVLANADHETAAADHTRAGNDHETASGDHTRAESDHTQAVTDSQRAASDHQQAVSDAEKAESDRTKAAQDRQQAAADHGIASTDHATAGADHQQAQSDHTKAAEDHTQAVADYEQAARDHTRAENDHDTASNDHAQAEDDHTVAEADHTAAAADHNAAAADHEQAANDHTQASTDHTTAASDHTRAEQDHTKAGQDSERAATDHSRAESDHSTAAQDHTTAASDHTLAGQDHSTAASDHTQAGSDHERAESDHSRAEEDHASIADKVSQEELAVAIDPLARKDGSYDTMSVGLAKNLEGRTNVTDSFFERTTGGDAEVANGLAQMTEVGGNSVKFNQLVDTNTTSVTLTSGRKYYKRISGDSAIVSGAGSAVSVTGGVDNIIDLTAIFGADEAIAASLGITTAEITTDAGVAAFEAWLAENVGEMAYYPYDEGSVVNVNMAGIETVGRNLLDPTSGKARILGAYSDVYGNYYGITGTHGAITFTSDMGETSTITPDEDGKFLLEEPGELSVADAGADCCVFLWWDGTQTDYVEHKNEKTYLDVTHIYGKLNGTGDLVRVWPTGMPGFEGLQDVLKEEDGAAVVKKVIGELDMGDIAWKYTERSGIEPFFEPDTFKVNSDAKVLMDRYVRHNRLYYDAYDKAFDVLTPWGSIIVRDTAYTDAATFKTAVTGQKLYYELATPETYTDLVYQGSSLYPDGTPVTLPLNYNADNWGIERVLPINTSEALATAKPELTCKYSIDAVETMNTHADEIADLYDKNDELDAKKSNKTGDYPGMAVGSAKVLEGTDSKVEDFVFTAPQCADGIAKLNEVRGKSLVWNQNAKEITTDNYSVTTNASISDGAITLYGPTGGRYWDNSSRIIDNPFTLVSGHKVFLSAVCTNFNINNSVDSVGMFYGQAANHRGAIVYINGVGRFSSITTLVETIPLAILGYVNNNTSKILDENDSFTVKNITLIDLTLMFGAGNEPTTVEEFEALYPLPYYAYNPGKIISNKTEAVEVVGRNQWDEEMEFNKGLGVNGNVVAASGYQVTSFIRVIPGSIYYFKSPKNASFGCWYDANKGFVSSVGGWSPGNTKTVPSGVEYIRLQFTGYGDTYNHDICINLSDPSFNGQYEPYKKNTIELNLPTLTGKLNGEGESVVVYPDGMRGAGTAYDKAAGKRGDVVMAEVDLGDLTWTVYDNGTVQYFASQYAPTGAKAASANSAVGNIMCENYRVDTAQHIAAGTYGDKLIAITNDARIRVYDSVYRSSDAATFKAAMSGVKLIFELAEPLVYELDEGVPETFQAYKGGTLKQLPENGSEPTTAPCVMSVTYALDAVGILTGLPQNYVSKESLQAMLTAMQSAGLFASYTMTFNATTGKYEFTFTANS